MTEDVKAGPFKLKMKTVKQWVDEFCEDGDALTIVKTKGGCSLHNKRNNMVYVLLDDVEDFSVEKIFEFASEGFFVGYNTAVNILEKARPDKEKVKALFDKGTSHE